MSDVEGTHRWKALRAWKAAALVRRLWKGSSVLAHKAELNRSRGVGATGSVSDQIRRLVRSQKSSAQVRVSVLVGREAALTGSTGDGYS
jgi:hypothetical protein